MATPIRARERAREGGVETGTTPAAATGESDGDGASDMPPRRSRDRINPRRATFVGGLLEKPNLACQQASRANTHAMVAPRAIPPASGDRIRVRVYLSEGAAERRSEATRPPAGDSHGYNRGLGPARKPPGSNRMGRLAQALGGLLP